MEESPVTTNRARTRLSANRNRKSKATPNRRVSQVKQEPESPIISTPPFHSISASSTPTVPPDLNLSTPRDEDDYRNHEIFTSSPFTVASSQMPLPGKEVFWNFDTPQAKKLREKMKAEASPVLPGKKISMPRQKMQIAKSKRENLVSTEDSEKCQEVFEEFLALCKPINTSTVENNEQVLIKKEDQNVDELEIKFQQSSMSPKLKGGVDEIKTENTSANQKNEIKTEIDSLGSDMFGDDMENVSELFENNIVDSAKDDSSDLFKDESDIPDLKVENQSTEPMEQQEVEINKIVKMSTSALFEDDDDSLLLQCTQAAESDVKQEHQPIIKTENQVEISLNVPRTVINTRNNAQTKPVIKPFETKEKKPTNEAKKPFTKPHQSVSAPTKPGSSATSSTSSVPKPFPSVSAPTKPVSSAVSSTSSAPKPFPSAKPTIPLKDITSLIQPNKPVNPVIENLAAEDEFGDDDSFDMLMSQMSEEDVLENDPVKNAPMSPVLSSKSAKRRKCFQLDKPPRVTTSPVLRNPVVPKQETSFKRFKSADDMDTKPTTKTSSMSVRRIQSSPSIPLHQIPKPVATSGYTTTGKTRQASGPVHHSNVVPASRGSDFGATVKQPMSNPTTVKPVVKCTKEDIDRKRMEALRKRQMSQQSQNSNK